MTIEQKARAYDEAIERARKLKNGEGIEAPSDWTICEVIFPELAESEDVRIRKALINGFKDYEGWDEEWFDGITVREAITWLEKQGTSYTKRDVDDAYLKGVTDTKNEVEKQYEANYQIRKDIATFIFNYRGDIKDRAKWMDYLGIKVFIVQKKDEQKTFCDKCRKEQPSHSCQDITELGRCAVEHEHKPADNRLIPRKGEYYVCINSYNSLDGKTTNTKGKVYKSPCDGYINDDRGFGLSWTNSCVEAYFSPVKDEDWIICENKNVIGEPVQYKTLKSNKVLQKAIKRLEDSGFVIKLKLWNIRDAKDGDVLANDHHIFILRELGYSWAADENPDSLYAYCGIKPNGNFELEQKGYCFCGPLHTHPATKEQRDLLFQKMREAYYEWDADKKELKRIEQKSADKVVKPKFSVGDWVVRGKTIAQILDIQEQYYVGLDIDGNDFASSRFLSDDKIHLWSIQDAKDGDVLSDGTTIFIFKDLLSDGSVMSYCDYDTNSGESDAFCPLSMNLMCSKITPATKEQRDAFMKAMTNAGYIFDFEKKELKKIENEIEIPFCAKGSELQEATYYIPKGFHAEIDGNKVVIKKGEPKFVWSKEDENEYNHILKILNLVAEEQEIKGYNNLISSVNWFRSLKDKYTWKPSDEQIEALETILYTPTSALELHKNIVKKLLVQLLNLSDT